MTNLSRLEFELNEKDYFSDKTKTQEVYMEVLDENNLDPFDIYNKENDQIKMLESVYTILQMLSKETLN